MNAARAYHTAALLRDGKVLVAGGMGDRLLSLDSAELYDPATGTWTLTNPMNHAHRFPLAALLADGRVLVTSSGTNLSEIYNPANGTWSDLGEPANFPFRLETASLLPDGKVLFEGIIRPGTSAGVVYDPLARSWTPTSAIGTEFQGAVATLLRNGQVLVAGAISDGRAFS